MSKRKERMYTCPVCKNNRTESYCGYCVWKGNEGPGKRLRDMVARMRDERYEQAGE